MKPALPPDTIAAISTPPGPGGVGMVRISGPDAIAVASRIFTPSVTRLSNIPPPRKALVGRIHRPDCPDEPIDQAVFLFFPGPRSFTGEDTVEITAHGGSLIMGGALEAATQAGARLAGPGEFTRRAYMNGRLDLSQAEAVASLIFASTEEARRVMLKQVEGAMGLKADVLRSLLLDAKVLLESAIDFPEDVAGADREAFAGKITSAHDLTEKLLLTAREGVALSRGLRVVIAGAPNVGKSSLLNALLEEERAIVHEIAGTTRDFIEGRISVDGIPVNVVDTAGLREGADSVEGAGIRRTRDLMEKADMLIVVLDATQPTGTEERRLLEETVRVPRVVVANKSDLPRSPAFAAPEEAVSVSALTGEGTDELKTAIRNRYLGQGPGVEMAGAVVTTLRQAEALERVAEGCRQALVGVKEGREPELLAVDVDEALVGVGELTGEVTVDDVLDEIFARFCIGK